MDKETLKKANELAHQIKSVEDILKGVKKNGELQIASWVRNDNTFSSTSQAGSIIFKPKDDFIGIGLMNLINGYLEYLNKELEKL